MSHQTGIKANEKLLKFFGKCRDGKIRVIKISIENEELTLSDFKEAKKDFEKDYDKFMPGLVEAETPCYLLIRLDTKGSLGHEWFLFSWTPDAATIRQKMLYASTKATLKKEFGSGHIKEEFHGTVLEEASLEGYKKHKQNVNAPAPLTSREEEMAELRRHEIKTEISNETRHQTLGGINCPIEEQAQEAIIRMAHGHYDYLQFRIELAEEKICLEKATNLGDVSKLEKQVPSDTARYHIFLFKHTHEGDFLEKFVFIYSMPGYICTVKERMMYSSCKAPFLEAIKSLGLEITKTMEIEKGDELTEDYLQDELHPKKILHRPQFAKPKGPPNRGAKRLLKTQEEL